MHRFAELGTMGSPGWSLEASLYSKLSTQPQSAQRTLCIAGAGTNSMVEWVTNRGRVEASVVSDI